MAASTLPPLGVTIVCLDSYSAVPNVGDCHRSTFSGKPLPRVPVLRVFGHSSAGQSACIHIHGMMPFFYSEVKLPDGQDPRDLDEHGRASFIQAFASGLEHAMGLQQNAVGFFGGWRNGGPMSNAFVHDIRWVSDWETVYGFGNQEATAFVQIWATLPKHVPVLAQLLLQGAVLSTVFQPYEVHLPYLLHFLDTFKLGGMRTLNIKTSSALVRGDLPRRPRIGFPHHPYWRKQLNRHGLDVNMEESFAPAWTDSSAAHAARSPHPKATSCELEFDCSVLDILPTQTVPATAGISPTARKSTVDSRTRGWLCDSLRELWEDEEQFSSENRISPPWASMPPPPEAGQEPEVLRSSPDFLADCQQDRLKTFASGFGSARKSVSSNLPSPLSSLPREGSPGSCEKKPSKVGIWSEAPAESQAVMLMSQQLHHSQRQSQSQVPSRPTNNDTNDEPMGSQPLLGSQTQNQTFSRVVRRLSYGSQEPGDGSQEGSRGTDSSLLLGQDMLLDGSLAVSQRFVEAVEKLELTMTQGAGREAAENPETSALLSQDYERASEAGTVRDSDEGDDEGEEGPEEEPEEEQKEEKTKKRDEEKKNEEEGEEAGQQLRAGRTGRAEQSQQVQQAQQEQDQQDEDTLPAEGSWPKGSSVEEAGPPAPLEGKRGRNLAEVEFSIQSTPAGAPPIGGGFYSDPNDDPLRQHQYQQLHPNAKTSRVEGSFSGSWDAWTYYEPPPRASGAGRGSGRAVKRLASEALDADNDSERDEDELTIDDESSMAKDRQQKKDSVMTRFDNAGRLIVVGKQGTNHSSRREEGRGRARPSMSQATEATQAVPKQLPQPDTILFGVLLSLEVLALPAPGDGANVNAESELGAAVWTIRDERVRSLVADRGYSDMQGVIAVGQSVIGLGEEVSVQMVPTEVALFSALADLLRVADPAVVIGFDVSAGSLGLLLARARTLKLTDFAQRLARAAPESQKFGQSAGASMATTTGGEDGDLDGEATQNATQAADDDNAGGATTRRLMPNEQVSGGLELPGRLVLNVWRVLRGEAKLLTSSLQTAAQELLGETVPHIPADAAALWWRAGGPRGRLQALRTVLRTSALNLRLLDALNVLPRAAETARMLGIDVFSVMSRGSQYRVEGLLTRASHKQKLLLLSPSRVQVANQRGAECLPMVLEPKSGFYFDPVIVLDFQSLYPSIIIAYNLCFSTCVGRLEDAAGPSKLGVLDSYRRPGDLRPGQLQAAPNEAVYVKHSTRRGVLPQMLYEILQTRIMVKKALKQLKSADPACSALAKETRSRLLDARQFGLKMIANVTYGYTSASFSGRMPCVELADSIVQTARRTLERAIRWVEREVEGAEVVYGDTDSLFVRLAGRTKEQAFEEGARIAREVTAQNPRPVELQMEKVYWPCCLVTKKRYVGHAWMSPTDSSPVFDAKGIETIRRDQCAATAKLVRGALDSFFYSRGDLSQVKSYLQDHATRFRGGRFTTRDFILHHELRPQEDYRSSGPLAAQAVRRAGDPWPSPGQRYSFIVAQGAPGGRLKDVAVPPREVVGGAPLGNRPHEQKSAPLFVDVEYYLSRQVGPALNRLFGLVRAPDGAPGYANVLRWLQDGPRPLRRDVLAASAAGIHTGGKSSLVSNWNATTQRCAACDQVLPASSASASASAAPSSSSAAARLFSTSASGNSSKTYNNKTNSRNNANSNNNNNNNSNNVASSSADSSTRHPTLCSTCSASEGAALRSLIQRAAKQRQWEARLQRCSSLCLHCSGSLEAASECRNIHCSVFFRRVNAQLQLKGLGGVRDWHQVLKDW